jgi:hypothetical protein
MLLSSKISQLPGLHTVCLGKTIFWGFDSKISTLPGQKIIEKFSQARVEELLIYLFSAVTVTCLSFLSGIGKTKLYFVNKKRKVYKLFQVGEIYCLSNLKTGT